MVGRKTRCVVIAGVVAMTTSAGCGGSVSGTSGSRSGDGAATGVDGGSGARTSNSTGGASNAGSGPGAAPSAGGLEGSGGSGGSAGAADSGSDQGWTKACADYFAVKFARPCDGPTPSGMERARLEALFQRACMDEYGLLAGGRTDSSALETCAKALSISDCSSPDGPPLACDFRGVAPGGAPCVSNVQCSSGVCDGATTPINPGGPAGGARTCGKCKAFAGAEESCDSLPCERGRVCLVLDANASTPHYYCREITGAALGQACDHERRLCLPGLYCDRARARCAALPGPGELCSETLCAPPFVCRADTSTCQPPGKEGDDCRVSGDRGCKEGLVCNLASRCEPVTWVEPGGTCDFANRCRVGPCVYPGGVKPTTGTCPPIARDGEPCRSDRDCDTFSHCVNADPLQAPKFGTCGSLSMLVCK